MASVSDEEPGQSTLPLAGLRVIDFSTLVPGPLATLMLAEAGAVVIKVERPDGGDIMRSYSPKVGRDSANFALLNRGKASVTCDLKDSDAVSGLLEDIRGFDVLVEQFRPGVMERLGLGYARLAQFHPGLIYCSITGYGQSGPRAGDVGHDLNYVSEAGLLDQIRNRGEPVLPHVLVADIGGGAYPAVINILLAVLQRQRTGVGGHLDIAMSEGVLPFQYWGLAQGTAAEQWPTPAGELLTGGSPRYNLYETSDGRWIAAAPLEDRFWGNFCTAIGLPEAMQDDSTDPSATTRAVRERIACHPADYWRGQLIDIECCCTFVRSLGESVGDGQFAHRASFAAEVEIDDDRGGVHVLPALPLPIAPALRRPEPRRRSPSLGPAIAHVGTDRG